MADELRVEVATAASGTVTVTVAGGVDIGTVGRFRAPLEEAAASAPAVVVDLDGVTYLDSAGIAALFDAAGRTALDVVASEGCVVRRVLEVVALDRVATVRPS